MQLTNTRGEGRHSKADQLLRGKSEAAKSFSSSY